jgi:hypothetical protein
LYRETRKVKFASYCAKAIAWKRSTRTSTLILRIVLSVFEMIAVKSGSGSARLLPARGEKVGMSDYLGCQLHLRVWRAHRVLWR